MKDKDVSSRGQGKDIRWIGPQQQQIASSEERTEIDKALYGREKTAQGHRVRFKK